MNQQELDIKTEEKTPTNVSDFRFAPIKGLPMLQWRGKRPSCIASTCRSTRLLRPVVVLVRNNLLRIRRIGYGYPVA